MKDQLRAIREQLLKIHSLLLDDQRVQYEQMFGRVNSAGELLTLVMEHECFSWLRALSSLIVRVDEMLDAKEWSDSEAKTLAEYAGVLMVPAQEGAAFRQKYWAAVQRSPDVLIAHGELKKLFEQPA